MTRSNDKHAFAVGLFILVGIAIIIVGIFVVGNQQKFFTKRFTVKSRFDSIGGLQPGNNIWLSGVKVGTVKAIRFYGEAQVEITMNIDENARDRIWKNSMARISSDGIIGNKIVILYGGSPGAGVVENDDLLKSSKGISTDEVMGVLETNNTNLLQITSNLKEITGQIRSGQGTLGALIYGNDLQQDLQVTLRNFRQASIKGQEMMAGLSEFSHKLNNGQGLIHELITDTSVFDGLQNSMKTLNETIENASSFINNLEAASSALADKSKPAGAILHDEEVAKDLKDIITNLKAGSKKLDEDLEALQHNFLLRGYFRKKAKGKVE